MISFEEALEKNSKKLKLIIYDVEINIKDITIGKIPEDVIEKIIFDMNSISNVVSDGTISGLLNDINYGKEPEKTSEQLICNMKILLKKLPEYKTAVNLMFDLTGILLSNAVIVNKSK